MDCNVEMKVVAMYKCMHIDVCMQLDESSHLNMCLC